MESQARQTFIAVDIGGTNTRLALVHVAPGGNTPRMTEVTAFHTRQDYDAQVAQIADAIQLAQSRAAHEGQAAAGVGVSVGGRIRRDGSGVAVAPNLSHYEQRPLLSDLASRCETPIRIAHDTVCGLLGERRVGALADADRCAYLTLSTGTGAAIYLGPSSSASAAGQFISIEFGHQLLDGSSQPCACGQIGCLETCTGGRQLARRNGKPLEETEDADLWEIFTDKLALGLVNLAHLTRVELVAIGGAIALSRPWLLSEIQRKIDARLRHAMMRLAPAALGEQAPLIGAAALHLTPPESILH